MKEETMELNQLVQELDELDMNIEKYSECYKPNREMITDYLSKRGSLLYKIGYLKGKLGL